MNLLDRIEKLEKENATLQARVKALTDALQNVYYCPYGVIAAVYGIAKSALAAAGIEVGK